jgi:hypothetical protein
MTTKASADPNEVIQRIYMKGKLLAKAKGES